MAKCLYHVDFNYLIINIHQNKNRRRVIVSFRQAFSSLAGNRHNNIASAHICGERLESRLSQSSCAPPRDARWRSIQISAGPPLGDGCDQIPEGRETKIDQMSHICHTPPPFHNIDRFISYRSFYPAGIYQGAF